MPAYDKTKLWQSSLSARVEDQYSKERERLRVGYERFRERVQPVAETIAHDLPEFTVHDVTHIDALWEYADLIAGPEYPLTPCEAFVLGGAMLIHDLGMGLASYPEGKDALKELSTWRDTIAALFRKEGIEEFDEEMLRNPGAEREKIALSEVLRVRHAQRAERLALTYWEDKKRDERFYLIEDEELRTSFGPIIGRIAHSHWWSVDKLAHEFQQVIGSPAGFPHDWEVDPLKLACLLRSADYCHIDDRRAPAFIKTIRGSLSPISEAHWTFQAKLYQPRLEVDRLVYTAKSSFPIDESTAWWVCYDTLHGIDSELRQVDSLLADAGRTRFAAKGISQCEEPSRLAKVIKTEGWQPVDTRIRVSAVAELVSKLGGKELYGNRVDPPLRELIQNAADAVRARRLLENRDDAWGEIRVSMGTDEHGHWLQVEDTGIGMSETVLTGPFLDFGTSFWGSSLMHNELPGLESKRFRATGQYGIGFFSVFMWGDRVHVTTRRYEFGHSDTLVLQFDRGLAERPLLRRAMSNEYIIEGGTRIKVWFRDDETFSNLLFNKISKTNIKLSDLCIHIAPCLDVSLSVLIDNEWQSCIIANDWINMDTNKFIRRLPRVVGLAAREDRLYNHDPQLNIIQDDSGKIYGRAALWSINSMYSSGLRGIICVDGMQVSILGEIIGVLIGRSVRAARDIATPLIPIPLLNTWLANERDLRLSENHPPYILYDIAKILQQFKVDPGNLPITLTN